MRMNEPMRNGCEMCKRQEYRFKQSMQPLPEDCAVAMAYVPIQTDTTVYDDMKALYEGTLFPVLNRPFMRGCRQ